MWLIEEKRFQTDARDIEKASEVLSEARKTGNLTLVVGNGPSQSAAWLHGQRLEKETGKKSAEESVSWDSVVREAARNAGLDKNIIENCTSYLSLAQAVLTKTGDTDKARSYLVDKLRTAFTKIIQPTGIDEILTALAPRHVVTTNYDFQLERAFEHYRPEKWKALVRCDVEHSTRDDITRIHKMHGSFEPEFMRQKYTFLNADKAESSIVITEADYDKCYREIGDLSIGQSGLMHAFGQTCLILGKSLDPQDISFMYALRKTRNSEAKRYVLLYELPKPDYQLIFYNLGVTPIVINMPRTPDDSGYYYFGMLAALPRLFQDHEFEKVFKRAQNDPIAEFPRLTRAPNVFAIGLASRNVTGRTTYNDTSTIPPAGRRNMKFNEAEESSGGSALTTLMIFSALDQHHSFPLSIASSIGNEDESHAQEILNDCRKYHIDTDAVSCNQPKSWHSTVLVHTSEIHGGGSYPGQRIFLDSGYVDKVSLGEAEIAQLHTQMTSPHLKVLYFDKFLAQQNSPVTSETEIGEASLGPLLHPATLEKLKTSISNRPSIDIIYETGGGGSKFQYVEKKLSKYVNIFTAGFPFFANVVIQNLGWLLPASLQHFSPGQRWWEIDFPIETKAIDDMLFKLLNGKASSDRLVQFLPNNAMLDATGKWAGRSSSEGRRWFIATLHHFGVLAIDLNHKIGWYCRCPDKNGREIENTSGAGDSFRGALMYALVNGKSSGPDALPAALEFSTDVATERCKYFFIKDAREAIGAKFGGKYADYEARALANL